MGFYRKIIAQSHMGKRKIILRIYVNIMIIHNQKLWKQENKYST